MGHGPVLLPSSPQFPHLRNGGENLPHGVGCCEVERRSCRLVDFPPLCRKSLQERANNSGQAHAAPPCLWKLVPLPPLPLSLTRHLFLAFPQKAPRLPGQLPNHRTLRLAFRDPPLLPPPSSGWQSCLGLPLGRIRPHGCPACYASTCREFIWNQHQQFVFIWGMQRSQGLWTELNSRTLYDSHQPMSIRPFTWKEARLCLSNSSKRRLHTSCSLKFHFLPLDDATQPCALSKTRIIREMMMRNDVSLIARDGKTTLFNISTFLLKYNTYRGKYTNYKCTTGSWWQGKIHTSTGLQHF